MVFFNCTYGTKLRKASQMYFQVLMIYLILTEVALYSCSCKKVFWKYAANLQKNTHAEVWFQ